MSEEQPLPAELLDELLSAQLDGEFDAAATDHGLDPSTAQRRIDATPGSTNRREALSLSRNAMPVEPLDDLTRRRILSRVAASQPTEILPTPQTVAGSSSGNRGWRLVAGIAAALLLVVGAASVLTTGFGDDSDSSGDMASSEEAADDGGLALELLEIEGDVSDPEVLRSLLALPNDDGSEAALLVEPTSPAAAESNGGLVDEPAAETGDEATEEADSASGEDSTDSERSSGALPPELGDLSLDESAVQACVALFESDFDLAPAGLYAAFHDASPALVVVFEDRGRQSAVVYEPGSCTVLVTQSIR